MSTEKNREFSNQSNSKIDFDLLKNLYNETVQDVWELLSISSTTKFDSDQLKLIFQLLRKSLITNIKKNEHRLILSTNNSFVGNHNEIKNDLDSVNSVQDIDVDEIIEKNESMLHSNESLSSLSTSSTYTCMRSKKNKFSEKPPIEFDDTKIRIPNIDKMIQSSSNKIPYHQSDPQNDIQDNVSTPKNDISNDNDVDENDPTIIPDKVTLESDLELVENDHIEDNMENGSVTEDEEEDINNIFDSAIPDQKFDRETNDQENDEEKPTKKQKCTIKIDNSNSSNQETDSDVESNVSLMKDTRKFTEYDSLIKKVSKTLQSDDDDDKNDVQNHDVESKINENKEKSYSSDEDLIISKKRKKFVLDDDDDEDEEDGQTKNNDEVDGKLNTPDVTSSSSSSDESDEKTKHKRKNVDCSNSDSKDSQTSNSSGTKAETKKPKKKRRRVLISDSDERSTDSDESSDGDDKNKESRKKIRKILSSNRLRDETRSAEKAELERKKRIEERQKLYNTIISNKASAKNSEIDRLVLDIDTKTKEVLVEVNQAFVKVLKPHQIKGVKFLYDCTIETVELLKKNHQSGCVLAHSMGLGKTLQIVTFLYTVMTNIHTKEFIKKVLIVVPLNVAQNWTNEFHKWKEECQIADTIPIFEMTKAKSIKDRIDCLEKWSECGGVLIITINLFSQLVSGKKFSRKQQQKIFPLFKKHLIDPGPDMVIVDEGHLLKNDKTALNNSLCQISTLRRVILTGTPLQNNLSEYFIMVDFVKPNLLGSKREFKNRFENPIVNGQHIDSTELDVKLMKKRVHILHKLLENCIHRCAYQVLVPYLEPKFEFVISIRLTEIQSKLYRFYLDNLTDKNGSNLLNDFSILRLIYNHPASLIEFYKRKLEEDYDGNSLKDFVVNTDEENSTSEEEETSKHKKKSSNKNNDDGDGDSEIECVFEQSSSRRVLRSQGPVKEVSTYPLENQLNDWWRQFMDEEKAYCVELSSKFIILLAILEQCEMLGDKLLVFSQSLPNLDLIEKILYYKMKEFDEKYGGPEKDYNEFVNETGGISHRWIRNIDYFRIDGSVKSDYRHSMIQQFNDDDNPRARLMLLSTKAGSLGINLIGANRCIIFDVSWNPTHDLQAIYRIYRYGQKKPVYIYRFIAYGTMENKIYDRQIIKQSMARRVVDEQQITRHFKQSELAELYQFNEGPNIADINLPAMPKDRLLADLFLAHKDLIISYHEHDSLLENRPEEDLTEEERKAAWDEYEKCKDPINPMYIRNNISWNNNDQNNIMNNNNPTTQFSHISQYLNSQYQSLLFNKNRELALRTLSNIQNNLQSQVASTSQNQLLQQQQQQQRNFTTSLLYSNHGQNPNQQQQLQYPAAANNSEYYQNLYNNPGYKSEPLAVQEENYRYDLDFFQNCYMEISQYFRRTIYQYQRFQSSTIETLKNEFASIYSRNLPAWDMKFLCWMTNLILHFYNKRTNVTEGLTNCVKRLCFIRNEFVRHNQYHVYSERLVRVIKIMNFGVKFPPPIVNLSNDFAISNSRLTQQNRQQQQNQTTNQSNSNVGRVPEPRQQTNRPEPELIELDD